MDILSLLNLKDKNIKIYIAGHNGMVGYSLLNKLKKNYKNITTKNKKDLNLLNKTDLDLFIQKNKFDLVIMCAARVGGILANSDSPLEFLYDNLQMQNNLIYSCYKHKVKNLIFLGSSCIYPNNITVPIKEDDLLSSKLEKTNEAYAIAKIAGLKLCEYISKEKDFNYKSVMPCNLYGYNDLFSKKKSHVIPSLILKFHEALDFNHEEVEIWGTGDPLREFLFVDDLSDAIIFLINNWEKFLNLNIPFINIGYGEDISIKNLSYLIKEITNFNGKLKFNNNMPDGTQRKLLDSNKINDLGWFPKINIKDGLILTYNWFLKNKKNYRSE